MWLDCADAHQQMYTTIDADAHNYVDPFRSEAAGLWKTEKNHDSVQNMAAAVFLSLGCIGQGLDHVVSEYSSEASSMGIRLGVFGVDQKKTQQKLDQMDVEEVIGASYTAWGVFNFITYVTVSSSAHSS